MEVHDTFLLLLVSKARAPSSPAFFFDTKYRAFYLDEINFMLIKLNNLKARYIDPSYQTYGL